MTRGGNRNPKGRPKSAGETRTANLCGIRVKPTQLAAYRQAAMRANLSLTAWVEFHLDAAAIAT